MGDHDGKGHRGRPIPVGCGHFFILLYSGEKIFHSHGASPCSAPHLLPHLPHPGCEHRKYLAPQLLPPSLHSLPEHWDTLGPPGQQRLDSAGGHGLDPLLRTPGFPEHPASILTGPPNVLSGCLLSAASTVRILMDFVGRTVWQEPSGILFPARAWGWAMQGCLCRSPPLCLPHTGEPERLGVQMREPRNHTSMQADTRGGGPAIVAHRSQVFSV